MTNIDQKRVKELQSLIDDFLRNRLEDELRKLKKDDSKRDKLQQKFVAATWLEDAANRVRKIQAVTHSLKPIHTKAKGSSLYVPPTVQKKLPIVGSHCLENDFALDVVGDAGALDVYKFLRLEHQGRSVLTLIMENDCDLMAAMNDDSLRCKQWFSNFSRLIKPRKPVASHTLGKQLYWPVAQIAGDDFDPHDDRDFHLLAPLYASSLAHKVYETVQDDFFSDEAKAARIAKREGRYAERTIHEYPQLAIQKLGGTKPQNVSQLNSERRGDNFLFASLPPIWRSTSVRPLLGTKTMFYPFGQRYEVRSSINLLVSFLTSVTANNIANRKRRASYVSDIIDEFLQFSGELRSLPSGWSQKSECHLSSPEKHWLDPDGVADRLVVDGQTLPADTAERISELFANWLNAQLRDPLPMGDPEYLEWRNQMRDQIKAEEREFQC